MPTEKTGFIYLGADSSTSRHNHTIAVPYPTTAPFETSRMVDAGRNTNGTMVGRLIGRSLDKVTLGWERIACEQWWQLHRWFEAGHFTFYCCFFNHNVGRWHTRLYYLGNVKVDPCMVDDDGEPRYYRNASFAVIDCGVV